MCTLLDNSLNADSLKIKFEVNKCRAPIILWTFFQKIWQDEIRNSQ